MSCKKCNGYGLVSYFENQSPLGSGMVWNEEIVDLCACLENDQCPRCGFYWHNNNQDFNLYCGGELDRFNCIYCLWQLGDGSFEVIEDDYLLSPEEKIIPIAMRQKRQLGEFSIW